MAPRRSSDLQTLIEEITVDCYNDDEELMGFENAFDEQAAFPCPGTVIGEEVTILSVATKNGRRELLATCEHHGRRYELALLDVDLHSDPATERLVAAYRYWASCR
jgi:Calcium binding